MRDETWRSMQQAAVRKTVDSRKRSLEVGLYRSAESLSKSNKSLYSDRFFRYVCIVRAEQPT
jgi:hypothetical protein